jgi:hypothetical protein
LKHRIVLIQQDGARPHTTEGAVEDLELAGTGEGWTVKVVTQPAQSPDLNLNNLGFFHSIKTKVHAEDCDETDHDPPSGEGA